MRQGHQVLRWWAIAMGALVIGGCGGGGGGVSESPAPGAPVVSLLAGTLRGAGAADGTIAEAQFHAPKAAVQDAAGTIYVADTGNHTIRRISPAGVVSTLAGSAGQSGTVDGTGGAARFSRPHALAVGPAGEVYVAEVDSNAIRRVDAAGVTTTVTDARFASPQALAVDGAGILYIGDNSGMLRRMRPDGSLEVFAEGLGPVVALALEPSGHILVMERIFATSRFIYAGENLRRYGADGAPAPLPGAPTGVLRVSSYTGLAVAEDGSIALLGWAPGSPGVVFPYENVTVDRVDAEGQPHPIAGGIPGNADGLGAEARFLLPSSLSRGNGGLLVADTGNHAIRRIDAAGNVVTVAGVGDIGQQDGAGADARFFHPTSIAVAADGVLLVADRDNARIRRVTPDGHVSSLSIVSAGQRTTRIANHQVLALATTPSGRTFFCGRWTWDLGGLPIGADGLRASGMAELFDDFTSGLPFAAESFFTEGCLLDRVSYSPEPGVGTSPVIAEPLLYSNRAVVAVTDSAVYWVVINPTTPRIPAGYFGLGRISRWRGAETDLLLTGEDFPAITAMTASRDDTLYIATVDNVIWVMDPAGNKRVLAGAPGSPSTVDGTVATARFDRIMGLALDPSGTLYVADATTIRRIGTDGVVRTIAGTAGQEGVVLGAAPGVLSGVQGIAWSGGHLYATVWNAVVRIGPLAP